MFFLPRKPASIKLCSTPEEDIRARAYFFEIRTNENSTNEKYY